MAQILDRTDDNKTRKGRIAKFKRGPGVFVYDGGETDTESEPTPKFMPNGKPDMDHNGKQKMGGPPILHTIPIDTYVLQGIEFPKGVPVAVKLDALALKLRGMSSFDEVSAETAPKRGRSKKAVEV
jgi:hypothetical protein